MTSAERGPLGKSVPTAKNGPITKTARQARIIAILEQHPVRSQLLTPLQRSERVAQREAHGGVDVAGVGPPGVYVLPHVLQGAQCGTVVAPCQDGS